MTKYLVIIAHSPNGWTDASPEQRQRWHQNHIDFHRVVGEHLLAGEALAGVDTATTLRHGDAGWAMTDGPYAESSEVIGGFYLLQADHLDQVTTWCELLPDCYALEIRPCVTVDGLDG